MTANQIGQVCTVANIINTTGVCALRNSNLSRMLTQGLLVYPMKEFVKKLVQCLEKIKWCR